MPIRSQLTILKTNVTAYSAWIVVQSGASVQRPRLAWTAWFVGVSQHDLGFVIKHCANCPGGMAKGDKVVASIRKGAASHSTTFQHPVLKHHKVNDGLWGSCGRGAVGHTSHFPPVLSLTCLCYRFLQGFPVREGLQLIFKIVRDKSIKEALLFALYFGVFLLISFEVWCPSS
jgi:hypothetical protein